MYQGHGGHPVLLGSSLVEFFNRQPDLPDFRRELSRFERIEVPCTDEGILLNINTKDDYKEFIRRDRYSNK